MYIAVLVLLFFLSVIHAVFVPVVLFHGMGDTANSEGMNGVKKEIEGIYPGIFVHSIQIGKTENADRIASLYDDANRQVKETCDQLSVIKELSGGFDAIGFSQGGQILRAYIQRCNNPPIRNLITIGSQHQGIMDLPGASQPSNFKYNDFEFELMQSLPPISKLEEILFKSEKGTDTWWQEMFKKNVYSDFIQKRIIQAQYYKDPYRMDEYLEKSIFLADINNDVSDKNSSYAENLASLDNFVMFMFTKDQQVIPKESSWFGWFDGIEMVELRGQSIYKEDWIGLKKLDEEGRLHFLPIESEHMRLPADFIVKELSKWIGDRNYYNSDK